jgi:hypothetical protein
MITSSSKIIAAVALAAALLGATIGGALVRSSRSSQPETSAATTTTTTSEQPLANDKAQTNSTDTEQAKLDTSTTSTEESAYRDGFDEGYRAARDGSTQATTRSAGRSTRTRVVYRNAPARYSSGSRQAYYDYSARPRGRTFWQKHRDKLTVAMGTAGGAILGGIIGGRKGAGIGALAGGGGSALYTYKLRNRTRRY